MDSLQDMLDVDEFLAMRKEVLAELNKDGGAKDGEKKGGGAIQLLTCLKMTVYPGDRFRNGNLFQRK